MFRESKTVYFEGPTYAFSCVPSINIQAQKNAYLNLCKLLQKLAAF